MATDERPPPWYKNLMFTLRSAWQDIKADWNDAREEIRSEHAWEYRVKEERRRILAEDIRHAWKVGPWGDWQTKARQTADQYDAIGRRRADLLRGISGSEDGPVKAHESRYDATREAIGRGLNDVTRRLSGSDQDGPPEPPANE